MPSVPLFMAASKLPGRANPLTLAFGGGGGDFVELVVGRGWVELDCWLAVTRVAVEVMPNRALVAGFEVEFFGQGVATLVPDC